jgi:hypothetical protein
MDLMTVTRCNNPDDISGYLDDMLLAWLMHLLVYNRLEKAFMFDWRSVLFFFFL